MSKPEEIIPFTKKILLKSLLEKGIREDKRGIDEYREITIEKRSIENANGSALVTLGNTKILAGVKVGLGNPYSDTPDQGALIVNAELPPLASSSIALSHPNEMAIELSRVIDRGIRSAEIIDLKDLSIIPGKKAWFVYIDVYVLNHDGNLFDASTLASVCALLNTNIKKTEIKGNEYKILDEKRPLKVKGYVASVTFAKIGNKIIVDPTLEEELAASTRITFTFSNKKKIVAIQKGYPGGFTLEEIISSSKRAAKLAEKLFEYYKNNKTY